MLGEKGLDDITVDVSEAVIPALEAVGELAVVDA